MDQRCRGATAGLAAWTAEEDERLRVAYMSGGIHAARAALPGRSVGSLYRRAQNLKLSRRRRWTDMDVARLRRLWNGEFTLRQIAGKLGRTTGVTYWKAQQIGLPLGRPDGWELITVAARRAGYCVSQLRRILAWDDVPVRRAVTKTRPSRARGGRRGRLTYIVPIGETQAAIEAWHETEPLETAARRIGVAASSLAHRLEAIGVTKPPGPAKVHWRVRAEDVERALAVRVRRGNPNRGPGGLYAQGGAR